MSRAGNEICGPENSGVILYLEERTNGALEGTCGSKTAAARGEKAVRSDIPGPGGNGATLSSTLNLSAHPQLTDGVMGAGAGDHIGSVLSARKIFLPERQNSD